MGWSISGKWGPVSVEEVFVTDQTKKSYSLCDAIRNNARVKKEACLLGVLTSNELRAAQDYIVKRAQVESFGEEIQCLEMGQEIHKKSRIKSLDPRMEDGFLFVGGRLQRAQCLPYKTRHPKIIDSRNELAQLIVEEMYCTYHHPPTEHLHNQIKQEYWIRRCRAWSSSVTSVIARR